VLLSNGSVPATAASRTTVSARLPGQVEMDADLLNLVLLFLQSVDVLLLFFGDRFEQDLGVDVAELTQA